MLAGWTLYACMLAFGTGHCGPVVKVCIEEDNKVRCYYSDKLFRLDWRKAVRTGS